MKIAFVRGAYLNNFEGQNYVLGKAFQIKAFSSWSPIHSELPFTVRKLPSLTDIGLPHWIGNRLLGDMQFLYGLEDAVRDFDIVHTADPHYYYSYQLAKLRRMGTIKCLVATSWETIPFNNESVEQKKRLKTFTKRYVDHFLCYSERAKQCLVKEGFDPKKISVINLGVDLRLFKPGEHSSSNKTMEVLFTGRRVEEKGIEDLEKLKGSYEIKKVSGLPYQHMPKKYQKADIFVMPSRTTKTWEEQYGMSLIEAMASGLPIVAYRSGSVPELLGNAGILVKEGDVVTLGREVQKLATNTLLRSKLGTIARKRAVQFFDAKKASKKLESFYEAQYRHTYSQLRKNS